MSSEDERKINPDVGEKGQVGYFKPEQLQTHIVPHSNLVQIAPISENDSNDEVNELEKMANIIDEEPISPRSPRSPKSPFRMDDMDLETLKKRIIAFGEHQMTDEVIEVGHLLHEAMALRKKYQEVFFYPWEEPTKEQLKIHQYPLVYKEKKDKYGRPTPKLPYDPFDTTIRKDDKVTNEIFEMKQGVVHVYADKKALDRQDTMFPVIGFEEYCADLKLLMKTTQNPSAKSYCYQRLKLLELKFTLHQVVNASSELAEQKTVPHRDFYNSRKVDTHVHLASAMNQKHLLRFIKKKLKTSPHEKVIIRDSKELTLEEVFKSLKLTSYDLSVDTLDVHADTNVFHRFDKFNLKYNPCGQSRLREIFLKTDNYIKGRYFAELCKEMFHDLEESKYQMAEPRVSIYGRKKDEWDLLSKWVIDNRLFSDNVRWLIQIPRLYNVHKQTNFVNSFQEMLENIFIPLFEVTRDPSTHPELNAFLRQVVGFDSVDDESKHEKQFNKHLPRPDKWNTDESPPYAYYNYYFWVNLEVLNKYRESKGLNTFKFRPHAGEAGDPSHLASAYLLAHNIAHGIVLRKVPVLQYLFYLMQIGLALSPLSNNSLFLNYEQNPFPQFFKRGMNVSLSTDDPLMFHFTKEPLMEEYSVAGQVWHLSNTDLCEIARNSVLQSGWEDIYKAHWLGHNYYIPGPAGNDMRQTNVPNLRIAYRHETLIDEHLFIIKCLFAAGTESPISYDKLMELINREKGIKLGVTRHLILSPDRRLPLPSNEESKTKIKIKRQRSSSVRITKKTTSPELEEQLKKLQKNIQQLLKEKEQKESVWTSIILIYVPIILLLLAIITKFVDFDTITKYF